MYFRGHDGSIGDVIFFELLQSGFTTSYYRWFTLHLDTGYRAMVGGEAEVGGDAPQQLRGAFVQAVPIGAPFQSVPIIEVAFGYDKWWSIPPEMSAQLYEKYVNGQDAGYTWDWGEGGRVGSWSPEGEETSINRYVIDFVAFVQTNLDNQRKRSVRIVWVRPQDLLQQFTGQLPTAAS